MGLDNPTDRTFVVEDTEQDGRMVAFSRWVMPQEDGNIDRSPSWPELTANECPDMDVANAFFGGMEASRHEVMGKRPHYSKRRTSLSDTDRR